MSGLMLTPRRMPLWICAFACATREFRGMQSVLPICAVAALSFVSAELHLPQVAHLQLVRVSHPDRRCNLSRRHPLRESCPELSPGV
jgi:hypothetical protein